MRTAPQARAEVAKLARLLGTDPGSLTFLDAVPAEDLRRFREQATDRLFDADREVLQRMAAASRVLPAAVVATIGERVFGPLLCARIAGMLDPGRAVDVASRLPEGFLADIAVELDPRRASDVIASIPAERIAAIAAELRRRGEHVTMGRFVGHLGDDAIGACLEVLGDADVLRIAFVLEPREAFGDVVRLLSRERLGAVIRAAAAEGLWPETLDLMSALGKEQQRGLVELAAEQEDGVLDALILAAQAERMWDTVLPLTRLMSPESRERFAGLGSLREDGVLEDIVRATAERGLWAELLPLVPLLPRDAQRRVGTAAGLDGPALERAVSVAAADDGLWPPLLIVAAELPPERQKRLAGPLAELGPAERRALADEAERLGVADDLAPLRKALRVR